MNKEQKKMNNKGFSLVELIVVIAIMAILVGVLAPQYVRYVAKSRISTDMQNVQAIKTAIEAYAAESGLKDPVKVTVTASGGIVITPGTNNATLLDDAGLTTPVALKASWGTGTCEYTMAKDTLQWSATSGSDDITITNNKKKYHMGSVFKTSIKSEEDDTADGN